MSITFGGIPAPKAPAPRSSQPTVSAPNARTNINDVLEGNYIGDRLEDVGLDPKLAEIVRMISPSKWDAIPMGGMLKGIKGVTKAAAKPAKTFLERLTASELLDDLNGIIGKIGFLGAEPATGDNVVRYAKEVLGRPKQKSEAVLNEIEDIAKYYSGPAEMIPEKNAQELIAALPSVGRDAGAIDGVSARKGWSVKSGNKLNVGFNDDASSLPHALGHELYGHLIPNAANPKSELTGQRLSDGIDYTNAQLGGELSPNMMAYLKDAPFKVPASGLKKAAQVNPQWAYSNLTADERAANEMAIAFRNFNSAKQARRSGQAFLPDPSFAADTDPNLLKEASARVRANTETLLPSNDTTVVDMTGKGTPPHRAGLDTDYTQPNLFGEPLSAAAQIVDESKTAFPMGRSGQSTMPSPKLVDFILKMQARGGR